MIAEHLPYHRGIESRLDVRAATRALAMGLGVGLAVGVVLWSVHLVPEVRVALVLSGVFGVVMLPGFRLLMPFCKVPERPGQTPIQVALARTGRVVLLYLGLLAICILLIDLLTGINLLRFGPILAVTVLIGLAITAFMTALHTTSGLVESERARARAEVDRLRMQLLEADNERKTKELEEARDLQLSMLPSGLPARDDLDVAFGMRTATEVGGDYYDYRTSPDGTLHLVLGDATGHGVKAGLVVVSAKTLFQTSGASPDLAQHLSRASDGIRSLGLRRMNMALSLLSIRGSSVRIASAGMPPAYHVGALEAVEVAFHAPPVGQLRSYTYREATLELSPGDRLVLCSDGFPECLDPAGQPYGYEALGPLLKRLAHLPAAGIVEELFREAERWAAGRPFEDDVTFLVVAYRG